MKKTIFHSILLLMLLVSINCCSGISGDSANDVSEDELSMRALLTDKFSTAEQLIYENDRLLADKEVLAFYKSTDYLPIWTTSKNLSETGSAFLELIDNAYDYGLLPEMFEANLIHTMVDSSLQDAEVLMTNAYYLYATHLNVGCIDSSNYAYVWKKDSITFSIEDDLHQLMEDGNVNEILLSHQPQIWDYQQLQKGLANYLDSFDLDTNHFSIPAFKDDSLVCYAAANEVLIAHHYLDSADRDNDSIFIERLKLFQLSSGLKPDAIVGKWTGRSLEKSNLDRFYQAALSLEKWRWKQEYPNRYIRVNIPEYTLYFIDKKQTVRKHRVVVGAYGTQTPEFHATMQRMVTNPFWHVPYSISSTEILAGARKDSAYFAKRGYKIFKGEAQVDPSGIDWNSIKQTNFPYKVRQDGGASNSLGKIKFLFPNVHSVFIHDTPSKSLFMNDMRAYSHGCVRLHEPYELAKAILAADQHKTVGDSLISYIDRGEQRVLELNEPFEVYIDYITAAGDSLGGISFFPDVYGRDEKYIANSFKKFQP